MAITRNFEHFQAQRSGISQPEGAGNLKRTKTISPDMYSKIGSNNYKSINPLIKPNLRIKKIKGSDSDSRKRSVMDEEPAHEEMNNRYILFSSF
jgi:hypothetical protein